MRILLDTHALIWWTMGSADLSRGARDVIADRSNEVMISTASLWEIVIKQAIGKLEYPEDFESTLAQEGFALLPIGLRHLQTLKSLPPIHRDPFDRMLAAQAISDDLAIITGDSILHRYGVQVMW